MRQEHLTHEQFVQEVAKLGIGLLEEDARALATRGKLVYGAGMPGLRGVTFYDRWLTNEGEKQAFVEVCAHGEENPVQLAGTTLHELGHVMAGFGCGHDKKWKECCTRLGLRRIHAAGTRYLLSMFDPRIREHVAQLIAQLNDGKPITYASAGSIKPRPCGAGVGTRGGKSRGPGSGSRLRKYECQCGQILRASTDTLQATHDPCGTKFELAR